MLPTFLNLVDDKKMELTKVNMALAHTKSKETTSKKSQKVIKVKDFVGRAAFLSGSGAGNVTRDGNSVHIPIEAAYRISAWEDDKKDNQVEYQNRSGTSRKQKTTVDAIILLVYKITCCVQLTI